MSSIKREDQELIQAILSGDPSQRKAALAYLYKHSKWRKTVYGIVLRGRGSEEEVKDIMHDGFTAFEQNIRLRKFKGSSSLDTYLVSICKNLWYKRLEQKQKAMRNKEKLGQNQVKETDSATTSIDARESKQEAQKVKVLLHELIEKLGQPCKKYLTLYMQDYSNEEIAELTELKNPTQARKATYQCRMRLRKLILEHPNLHQFFKNRGS